MDKQQALNEAKKVKAWYPYRWVGVVNENGVWRHFSGKTRARANNLVRKGLEVHIVTSIASLSGYEYFSIRID